MALDAAEECDSDVLLALLNAASGIVEEEEDEELPDGLNSSPYNFFSLAVGFPAVRKDGFSTLRSASETVQIASGTIMILER